MKPFYYVLLLLLLASCTTTTQVNLANDYYYTFGGRTYGDIVKYWGAPNRVESDGQGGKKFSWLKAGIAVGLGGPIAYIIYLAIAPKK